MLRQRVEALCRDLRLEFVRDHNQLWVKDYRRKDGGNFTSFSIKGWRWKDFSEHCLYKTAKQGGDLIGLIAEFETAGDNKEAFKWALSWLGLSNATFKKPDPEEERRRIEEQRRREEDDAERARVNLSIARKIFFFEAEPLTGRDPASLYLFERGIDVLKLKDGIPSSLRFAPKCLAKPENMELPAMVARVSGRGGMVAVHRTYLDYTRGAWCKAFKGIERDGRPVAAKRTLGRYVGGTIRLTRGATGVPLAKAPKGEWIAVSEGIENALTVALAAPELRCLAACSISNLGSIELPKQIGGVAIIADNDTNDAAAKALDRAMDRLEARGYESAIIKTAAGFKDINDWAKGNARV